jgi:hypothetical protein
MMQFADVGFVPVGHARDLDVAHTLRGQVLAKFHRDIALHDLAVVEVHLNLHVGHADFGDDSVRVVLAVQEVAGNVAAIDRLDQQVDADGRRLARGPCQIGDEGGAMPAITWTRGHLSASA